MVNKNYKKCEHYESRYSSDRFLYDACTIKPNGRDYGDCDENCPLINKTKNIDKIKQMTAEELALNIMCPKGESNI